MAVFQESAFCKMDMYGHKIVHPALTCKMDPKKHFWGLLWLEAPDKHHNIVKNLGITISDNNTNHLPLLG